MMFMGCEVPVPPSIQMTSLKFVKRDDKYLYVDCPVCNEAESTHYAMINRWGFAELQVPILHCFPTGEMRTIIRPDIIAIIEEEERKFLDLLRKFDGKLPDTCTAEEAFTWITSRGVPAELFDDRCHDVEDLAKLLEGHRATSRQGSKFRSTVFE